MRAMENMKRTTIRIGDKLETKPKPIQSQIREFRDKGYIRELRDESIIGDMCGIYPIHSSKHK